MAVLCPNCHKQFDVALFQFGREVECDCGTAFNPFAAAPFEIPVDGVLDLHTFRPSEVKDLVPEYLHACLEKKILRIRIIHGKGTGTLLKTIHAILKNMSDVEAFDLAGENEGGWGATIVRLKEPPEH
jgi:DNA-nicking Smr family endonuclease